MPTEIRGEATWRMDGGSSRALWVGARACEVVRSKGPACKHWHIQGLERDLEHGRSWLRVPRATRGDTESRGRSGSEGEMAVRSSFFADEKFEALSWPISWIGDRTVFPPWGHGSHRCVMMLDPRPPEQTLSFTKCCRYGNSGLLPGQETPSPCGGERWRELTRSRAGIGASLREQAGRVPGFTL